MASSGEPPAAAGDIDGYPLLTRAAMLAVATVGATIFAISPLLPDIARSFAIEPGQAGLLLTVYSIVLALAAPVVGLTAKQLPRSRVIVGGLVVFALAWLGAGQAQSFEVLLALGALAGAATGTVLPAAYALAGDLSSYEQRGRAVGRIVSGWSIAILLVVPTMAFAAQVIDWRSAFAGLALAALGCALAIALAPRPPQAVPAGPLVLAALFADLRAVLSDRGARLVLAVNLINMGAFYGVYAFLGSELRQANGWDSGLTGLMIAVYGVGLSIVTRNAGWIDRIGKERSGVMALCGLGVLLVILTLLVGMPPLALASLLCWGLLQGTFFTSITALATEQVVRLRGVMTAMLSCSTYVGVTLFTPGTAWLYQHFGFYAVGIACGLACVAAAALLTRLPIASRGS